MHQWFKYREKRGDIVLHCFCFATRLSISFHTKLFMYVYSNCPHQIVLTKFLLTKLSLDILVGDNRVNKQFLPYQIVPTKLSLTQLSLTKLLFTKFTTTKNPLIIFYTCLNLILYKGTFKGC